MTEGIPSMDSYSCPLPLAYNERIVMGHGSGGRMSHELISKLFLPAFENTVLQAVDDAGLITIPGHTGAPASRLAVSTDSHVVTPLFFPGGDIGRLAICGTVNDISMLGATPLYLTVGLILEEGLEMETLHRVVASMQSAAAEANISIIAGDTKVVQHGKADGMYINTTGIGTIPAGVEISGAGAQPGDALLVSGSMGDHGIAVLAARGELKFETELTSDVAALNGLVATMLEVTQDIHVLRDPTRGGLATSLNEIALQSQAGILIEEKAIPVKSAVRAACEMLGFDPLYVANEGKLIAFVQPCHAEELLARMKAHPLGKEAAIIGRVTEKQAPQVMLRTAYGTTRMVEMLAGEMLPRIC